MDIKPIETRYKGCRFRSRLEARWAVFFDAAGISWEYEVEGFPLPSGPYLPDFKVTIQSESGSQCKAWIEIKPELPDPENHEWTQKYVELRNATGMPVVLLMGQPGEQEVAVFCWVSDDPSYSGSCTAFGGITVSPSGDLVFLLSKASAYLATPEMSEKLPVIFLEQGKIPAGHGLFCDIPSSEKYDAAVIAARSARFEHGECG